MANAMLNFPRSHFLRRVSPPKNEPFLSVDNHDDDNHDDDLTFHAENVGGDDERSRVGRQSQQRPYFIDGEFLDLEAGVVDSDDEFSNKENVRIMMAAESDQRRHLERSQERSQERSHERSEERSQERSEERSQKRSRPSLTDLNRVDFNKASRDLFSCADDIICSGDDFDGQPPSSTADCLPFPIPDEDSPAHLATDSSMSSFDDDDDVTLADDSTFIATSPDTPPPPPPPPAPAVIKGVTFHTRVRVLPIPSLSCYTPEEKYLMYSNGPELRHQKARNKKEFAFDNFDWKNATEEHDMAICPITGQLLHPAHF